MPATPEELIASIPILRRVTPDDRRRLASVSRVRELPRGARIFDEGDPADHFWLIARGRVKVFKTTPAGRDVILEIFGAGDPLGAVAVYEGGPYPASAVAISDVTFLVIPQGAFFALVESHPSFARGLLAGLTERLVHLTRRISELSGARVEARLARLFLKLADESGVPDSRGTLIPVSLSRRELADLAGTTIETAIRIMSRWGKQRLVLTLEQGFVLVDRASLEGLASGERV